MTRKLRLQINAPERVDHATSLHGYSRNQLKPLFKSGKILLNGKPVEASRQLQPGEYEIKILEEPAHGRIAPAVASPRGCFLPVVYESETLLVLNKASGVASVPHTPDETDTAVSAALAHFPGLAQVGSAPLEPGLLHRIDTETSGLLAFAKSREEYDRLRALWRSEGIQKIYRAVILAEGKPMPPLPLSIDFQIAHSSKSSRRMLALTPERKIGLDAQIRGKPLDAHTEVLRIQNRAENLVDLEIRITTGVMHQIRCHLSESGWPILGDRTYGGAPAARLMLHAWKLVIPLTSGRPLEIEAPTPSEWPM